MMTIGMTVAIIETAMKTSSASHGTIISVITATMVVARCVVSTGPTFVNQWASRLSALGMKHV